MNQQTEQPDTRSELEILRDLVRRAHVFVDRESMMMADISRFSPLDPASQAVHDNTCFPSDTWLADYEKWLATQSTEPDNEPIHGWFELSYAQYLTIPRSVLQSMPVEWQQLFVELLRSLDNTIKWRPEEGRYRVRLYSLTENGEWGREIDDPLMDYERGRRRVDWNNPREQ